MASLPGSVSWSWSKTTGGSGGANGSATLVLEEILSAAAVDALLG